MTMEVRSILGRLQRDRLALDLVSVGFLLLFWVLLIESVGFLASISGQVIWAEVPTIGFVLGAAISITGYLIGRAVA